MHLNQKWAQAPRPEHEIFFAPEPDPENVARIRAALDEEFRPNKKLGQKHKKHYTRIIKTQNAFASPPVKRMIEAYAKKHNIDDFENMDLINKHF